MEVAPLKKTPTQVLSAAHWVWQLARRAACPATFPVNEKIVLAVARPFAKRRPPEGELEPDRV